MGTRACRCTTRSWRTWGGSFARISRRAGDGHITVDLLTHAGERTHQVQANNEDDLFSMAQILQHALDGYEGSNSEVHDYLRMLQYLAD